MKKLVLAVLFVFALSSVAFASPLTDFSKGKASLDLNFRSSPDLDVNPGINGLGKFGDIAFEGDSNLEWGFTYGIGNNWALQYRQGTSKGNRTLWNKELHDEVFAASIQSQFDSLMYGIMYETDLQKLYVGLEAKVKVDEYNIMRKLNKNLFAFTGLVKASPSAKLSISGQRDEAELPFGFDAAIVGHDKNIWQFGLQAVAPFADKFTGYGIAAFGSDYRNWEVGVGYQISKDLELNVNYRDMKIDNMTMVGLYAPISNELNLGDVTSDVRHKGLGFGVTYKF